MSEVNSFRFYQNTPTKNYFANVELIFYPGKTHTLDALELVPKVKHWLETTPQSMGNWVSRETVFHDLELIDLKEVPIYGNEIPLKKINELLRNNGRIIVIGFNVLQLPFCKLTIQLEHEN